MDPYIGENLAFFQVDSQNSKQYLIKSTTANTLTFAPTISDYLNIIKNKDGTYSLTQGTSFVSFPVGQPAQLTTDPKIASKIIFFSTERDNYFCLFDYTLKKYFSPYNKQLIQKDICQSSDQLSIK